jgi:hypothetical protein
MKNNATIEALRKLDDDDNKYKKFALTRKRDHFKKYYDLLSLIGSSSLGILSVYLLLGAAYLSMGGHPGHTSVEKVMNFLSISIEVLGLLVLRHKIQVRSSVKGISGMTIITYAVVYTIRIWLAVPDNWSGDVMDLNIDSSFGLLSLLLALDILRSVFVTHRSSYQSDLDVLNVKYLLPGCCVLALLVRPQFHTWTTTYSFVWSSCMYMDVLALMPQVLMMSRGGGKVEAPIAHFVAATFLSRIEDLSDTILYHSGHKSQGELFSYWLVVFIQGLHLLLVADFMYYYVKARTSGSDLVEDLDLHAVEV